MCKLDDEKKTGYATYRSILDAFDMLEFEFDEQEVQYAVQQMFQTTVIGIRI